MALSSKKLIIGIFALIAGTLCVIKLALGADRMMSTHNENNSKNNNNNAATPAKSKADSKKDSLYKYQQSYLQYDSSSTTYTIAVISDKDKDSKVTKDGKSKWESNLMTGTLKRDPVTHKYSVSFSNKVNKCIPTLSSFCCIHLFIDHNIQVQAERSGESNGTFRAAFL